MTFFSATTVTIQPVGSTKTNVSGSGGGGSPTDLSNIIEFATVTTSDSAPTILYAKSLPEDNITHFRIMTVAKNSDNSKLGSFVRETTAYRLSGSLNTQLLQNVSRPLGSVFIPVHDVRTDTNLHVNIFTSSDQVVLTVSGISGVSVEWKARIDLVNV